MSKVTRKEFLSLTALLAGAIGTLLLVACGVGRSTGEQRPAPVPIPVRVETGRFEYVANLPGERMRGTMRVFADTITIEAQGNACRLIPAAPDVMVIRYECFDVGRYARVVLELDRRNPQRFSKWIASAIEQRRRQVCAEFRVTPNGQRVCVRMETQYYDETVRYNGTLEVAALRG